MEKLYLKLVDLLALASGVILALIALLIPVNLVLKAFFASSIYGLLDAIEYGLMSATFLAAPWVLRHNAHVVVDIFTMALPRAARSVLSRAINLLGAALCGVLAWYAMRAALVSFERGSMIRTAFNVPEWLSLVPPTVAGILLAIEFLRRARADAADQRSATGL